MFYQKNIQMGFYDGYVEKRTRKNTFFKQINMLIDWSEVEKEIKKVYKRGHSVDGRPAYSGLLLFKMLLLGIWYGLSDEKIEESVNDSLSMMRFCDLDIEDNVPDHSVLSRFRSELKPCLENQDEEHAVRACFTDKGYQVPDNVKLLKTSVKKRKVKNRIMHKAYKNRPLTEWQKQYNRLISKKRWVVERTFGSMRRWFRCGVAMKNNGKLKTKTKNKTPKQEKRTKN